MAFPSLLDVPPWHNCLRMSLVFVRMLEYYYSTFEYQKKKGIKKKVNKSAAYINEELLEVGCKVVTE